MISIVIPTKNSARTLNLCLKSIEIQSYPHEFIEILIVDSYSEDDTINIAQRYNCKIIYSKMRPLGARYIGFLASKGDIIMFIDADHILARRDLLFDIVNYINKGYEILHLEEISFNPRTLIQKLIAMDRYTNQQISKHMPLNWGTLYPRVFKRTIISRVYSKIPKQIIVSIHEHEDVIIHYEAISITRKHTSIPRALFHVDEEKFWSFLKKITQYGSMDSFTKSLVPKKYKYAIMQKQAFRIRELPYLLEKHFNYLPGVLLLLGIKYLAYKYGNIKGCSEGNILFHKS